MESSPGSAPRRLCDLSLSEPQRLPCHVGDRHPLSGGAACGEVHSSDSRGTAQASNRCKSLETKLSEIPNYLFIFSLKNLFFKGFIFYRFQVRPKHNNPSPPSIARNQWARH